MKQSDYVTTAQLCQELGLSHTSAPSIRKYIRLKGYEIAKVRLPSVNNQLVYAIDRETADKIKQHRLEDGYSLPNSTMSPTPQPSKATGYFYIIQLVPDLSPNRIKFGFTNDLRRRIDEHRTSSPTCILLVDYPCKKSWEIAAIDSISREGCTRISNEVVDCASIDQILLMVDKFFSIMPKI